VSENSRERAGLLNAEIGRLESEIVVLDRQWSKKHWLGLIALAAIPLMIAHASPLWVVIAILAAPALVATQAYLLYVRRRECRHLIEQARQDLDWVESGAPPIGGTSRA
jgi:hypothetical protein